MTKNHTHVAPLKPENQQQVQAFIEDILQRSKLPGISVAMDVNGQTLQAAAGVSDAQLNHPMTTAMHFELGCLNKFLTAIVVLELANDKKIDLEQVISYYLPELKGKNGDIIKVKHLLSHSAGYQGENLADPDVQMDYSYEEFCESFNQRPMLFEPGTLFDYSHSSSIILAKIINNIAQKKASDLIKEIIFKPLKINALKASHANPSSCVKSHQLDLETAQLHQPFPIDWCHFWSGSLGGAWIKMDDLVKLGRAIIDQKSPLSKKTKAFLLSPAIKLPGLFVGSKAEQPFFQFGLGCARFPNGSYGVRSNSLGQCFALRFDLEKGIIIAVGINADAAHIRDFTIDKLFNAMLPEDAQIILELSPAPESELPLDKLVGTYRGNEQCGFTVSLKGKRLALKAERNPSATQHEEKTLLYFIKDKEGHVKPQSKEAPISISFFKDIRSGKINIMVDDSCLVVEGEPFD